MHDHTQNTTDNNQRQSPKAAMKIYHNGLVRKQK